MKNLLKIFSSKDNIFLVAVLFFAFLVRIIYLGQFPIGMTHDELNNIFAAKSLFWTFSFPPGTAPAILPINMSNFTITIPEVPALFLAPLVGPLQSSMFNARIAGAILSVLSVLAIYFIVLHITKKRIYAQLSMLIMAINPWSILMGRTMCELNFFIAFFLWGFLILINSRGWKMFSAIPFYLLGFFSYTGGQISFLIFVIITLIYRYFLSVKDRRNLGVYAVFLGLFSLIFVGYIFIVTKNQSFKVRNGEIYLPNLPQIAETVDGERKLSVPTPLNSLFTNKATVYINGFISKYINTFSVNTLFLNGETRAVFSYQTHGTFYLIDLLFIVIGISALFSINKKGWLLCLAVLIGCSVTSGLSVIESSYSQRVGLIYPFLIMLSGIGVGTIVSVAKSTKTQKILISIIAIFYLLSFINLMYIYFIRFPVYASDGWFFQDRVLSNYLRKTKQVYPDAKIYVYTSEPKIIFEEYLFYTNSYTRNNATSINNKLNTMNYSINDIVFTDKCPGKNIDKESFVIFEGSLACSKTSQDTNPIRITRLKDVLENYLIYNDKLCNGVDLNRYVPQSAYQDFSLERQSINKFCSNWITIIE